MTLPTTTSPEAAGGSYEAIKWLQRAQWIRAAILGANDGLMSTTALMLGVGAAKEDRWSMIISGVAGALAGACSMAVGEFVSVSTQRDIEETLKPPGTATAVLKEIKVVETADDDDVIVETLKPPGTATAVLEEMKVVEIADDHDATPKVIQIFSPPISLVMKVIAEETEVKSTQNDTDRDGDGSDDQLLPNPYKAAGASGLAFLCGSSVPLVPATFVAAHAVRVAVVVLVASVGLAVFGGLGARLGGSNVKISAIRVLLGGWMAMGVTYGLLQPFDTDKD